MVHKGTIPTRSGKLIGIVTKNNKIKIAQRRKVAPKVELPVVNVWYTKALF